MRPVKILLTGFLLLSWMWSSEQSIDTLFVVHASSRPFTLADCYALILDNHPIAKQAALLPEVARQELRLAKGAFDPKLELHVLDKELGGQEYYNIVSGQIKFPTTLPFDPVVGLDRNRGPYVNPERYISDEYGYRQVYTGISLPLGRGLITDERRAALRQAELLKDLTDAEKVSVINKLLLDAAKKYWDWCYSYYKLKLLNRSVSIAEDILQRTKDNYTFGEASLIDTVQASITFQQRIVQRQEAIRDLENSSIELSALLWNEESKPVDLDPAFAPAISPAMWTMSIEALDDLIANARENHPDIRKVDVKLQQLEVDRRLAVEYLKPELNLSYYALNQPISPEGPVSFNPGSNHKFGVDIAFPLFLRKERSKVALARVKITNTRFEQSLKEREIINSLNVTYNQLSNLQMILASQRNIISSYESLVQAELLNLEQGESDLFKFNLQQEKLIEAQTKWLKLLADNEKLKAYLYWAAGDFAIN